MTPGSGITRLEIQVRGIVQGVGFRPFVYRLATEERLAGWVRNTSTGVQLEVEGPESSTSAFLRRLREEAPALARIEEIVTERRDSQGATLFQIRDSSFEDGKGQLVSPDVATCADCLAELMDPTNRRYRYPFTNCTNCGPRFTIITDMPYDRPSTTMRSFRMCPECQSEYDDPSDRRFHAQPNACPVCGPHLTLLDAHGKVVPCTDAIAKTSSLLTEGAIVAIKGLGGFLLACDATSRHAVSLLRQRKQRPSKPFAVMVTDLHVARHHCEIGDAEAALLESPAAPIVLGRWKRESSVCPDTAPGLVFLGLMLPYTPLHHVLMRDCQRPLVMTSGNLSEEPIIADDDEALERLSDIADYFLLHNRPICSRYDDSVAMVVDETPQMLRRARGFAPRPVDTPFRSPPLLATGSQTKNTFTLATGHHAFVSQHIGDLDSVETLDHYEATVSLYTRMFRIEPKLIAHDLHPDYLSTHYAQQMASQGLRPIAVQHHHAHIAACMAENAYEGPVIGVAYDGAGLGSDGHIWGGEFLICDFRTTRRAGHIEYLPLAGGDAATLRPYRTAAGYVASLFGKSTVDDNHSLRSHIAPEELSAIVSQVEHHLNAPLTSSMGRLFDAVAAIAGIRYETSYEGQAAIELEAAAHRNSGIHGSGYTLPVDNTPEGHIVRVGGLLTAVLRDATNKRPDTEIAAAFHEAVAQMTTTVCEELARNSGIHTVALSGGVFQNRLLLSRVWELLRTAGLTVLVHNELPSNDACVSLGQAAVAAHAE
ncbi:MAG: carbamoyltransferase HypF [Dehalococcoidia bacterium]|nr:carbamoyltransferase HypF [Dehalococcoidia bacterium]